MQFSADLSGLEPQTRQAVIKKLRHEDRARYELGVIEQIRMKRMYDSVVKTGAFNECGPATMILSQDQYQRAMAQHGQLCFMDPNFAPWLLKNNDDMRVKSAGTRIQVGWSRPAHESWRQAV